MTRDQKIEALRAVFKGKASADILLDAIPFDLSAFDKEELNFLLYLRKEKRKIDDCSEEEKSRIEDLLVKQLNHKKNVIKRKKLS